MTFRGKTYRKKLMEVFGWYYENPFAKEHYIKAIVEGGTQLEDFRIIPETLAMETGKEDKNGKMIFGSIEVNGKMSSGGSRLKINSNSFHAKESIGTVVYYPGQFRFALKTDGGGMEFLDSLYDIEIIGTQGDVLICNNCKRYWKSPKERCTCGSTTLTKTDDRNIKFVEEENNG
jgi:hypothetical protein